VQQREEVVMASKPVPILDYPVLSRDRRYAKRGASLATAKRGQKVTSTEHVYRWKDWNTTGRYLGTVTIDETPQVGTGKTKFTAVFTLTGGIRVAVDGFVPGDRKWAGKGRAKARMAGRPPKDIDIEGKNPKKWG
jgi:hypothetical protein